MSDDFDKDDFSWLRDDDDQPDDEQTDASSEWETGDEADQPQGDELGFTNMLPWLQDDDEDAPASAGGDDRLGLTGELPWLQGDAADAEVTPADEASLDWLAGDEATVTDADDVADDLDWLRDMEPDEAEDAAAPMPGEEPAVSEVPDWLSGLDEPTFAEPAAEEPAAEVPDWLSGMDEPTFEEPAAEEPVAEVPDWLSGMDEPTLEELTAAEPAASEVPDWLLGVDDPTSDEIATPFDEPSESEPIIETPDWLSGADEPAFGEPAIEPPIDEVPDWLQAPAASEPELEADLADLFGDLDDDDFSLEAPAEPAAAPVDVTGLGEDWFADLGEDDAAFALETPVEPDAPADEVGLDEDWFAELGGDDAGFTLETPAEPVTPSIDEAGFAALFADVDDEDDYAAPPPQRAQPEPVADDFAALFADDFAEQPFDIAQHEDIPDGELLSALGIESPEDDRIDWFADEEAAPAEAEMSWLDDLGDARLDAAEEAETLAPADADILAGLEFDAEPPAEPAFDDIDSLLEAMEPVDMVAPLPGTGDLSSSDINLDDLLGDPAFSDIEQPADASAGIEAGEGRPDWLEEAGITVSGMSVAALVRQQKDRPLEELDERWQRLRDRSTELDAPTDEDAGPLADLLPGVKSMLSQPKVDISATGITSAITLTAAQRSQVDLLKSLAVSDDASAQAPSAIDRTYDSPFMADEDEFDFDTEYAESAEAAPAAVVAPARRGLRQRIKIDRLLIAVAIAVAVLLPFGGSFVGSDIFNFGELPPAMFAADSREQAVFDALDSLRRGDLVLVALEYGPTAAGELDGLTRVLLRHMLARGARPVVIGTNPVGLARMDNMLSDLGGRANRDYYVTRFLAGNLLGLRALAQDFSAQVGTDINGNATGLAGTELDDLARIVVIAERPEDLRAWAEQVLPVVDVTALAATGFAAEPLAEPYIGPAFAGLVVGYRDTLTYDRMLGAPPPVPPDAAETDETPATDDEIPAEITPEVTAEVTAEVTPTTPPLTGTINAAQAVNLREGPGTNFASIGSVAPNTVVTVIDTDDSGNWLNIRLPDGGEGWVAASLVGLDVTPTATATDQPTATATATLTSTPLPSATPAPTDTPTATDEPTDTPRPTDTPAPTATDEPTATAVPSATPTEINTVVTARVIAAQRVNVREGPGTEFTPVGALAPGATVTVIGRNGDGTWIQIELDDGTQGWIAAFLLEISVDLAPTPEGSGRLDGLVVVMGDSDLSLSALLAQDATPVPTAESTPEATAADAATDAAFTIPLAAERWYGMNLGLAVIIVIIVLGALVGLVRALRQRRG